MQSRIFSDDTSRVSENKYRFSLMYQRRMEVNWNDETFTTLWNGPRTHFTNYFPYKFKCDKN